MPIKKQHATALWSGMSPLARSYIVLICLCGCTLLAAELPQWVNQDPPRFVLYLMVTLLAAGLKVRLPGVTGTMSVYFLFLLIGIQDMPLPQLLVIGIAATALQAYWRARNYPTVIQLWFNASANTIAIAGSYTLFWLPYPLPSGLDLPVRLALSSMALFVGNTGLVAIVVGLTDGKPSMKVWKDCYFWCFPYYLAAAPVAVLFHRMEQMLGWQTVLMLIPVIYFVYRSYRLYLDRLDNEKSHAQEMARLHLRTIEALALAIEAKDHTTHDHLRRVVVYAVELGKELHLSEVDLEALRAASLLHDIGKLAVPEHIISKPGKLTAEEFEKMKIHPQVGAQILERVQFPYPVAAIVRAHHEKWDGSGYPLGLKAEEIPLAARILSAVDCLDALASPRQYRRALPLDKAMLTVESEAGRSYDPIVVAALQRRYQELEQMTHLSVSAIAPGPLDLKVDTHHAEAPGAGLQADAGPLPTQANATDFLQSIAAAREEAQGLFELAQSLGTSLSLTETLSVMAARLKRLVPYDSVAMYVLRGSVLKPAFASGVDQDLFSNLAIPLGQGLSGWVAENQMPIINGNPSVETGYLNDPAKFSTLNSALAVPLTGTSGAIGVLAIYQRARDAFSRDQLRILLAIGSKLAASIENALKYEQAESSATIDYLTGLPNARGMFVHLDAEVARCQRSETALTVLVCDLDGFKQINDQFGHIAGNKVLSLLAAKMQAACREYDCVARMGGDEFVVVLPGITRESLPDRVRTLSGFAEEAAIEACGSQNLGLSVGAAVFPDDGATAEELLSEADRQMYKNKRSRREAASRESLHEALQPNYPVEAVPPPRVRIGKPT